MSAVALSGAAALPVVVAAHASADFRSTWFPSLHGYLLHPYRVFVSSLFLAIVLLVGAERILWRREVDMDVGRAVSAAAAAALCLSAPSAFAYRPRQVEEEEGEMMPPGDNQTARFTVAPAGIVSPEALEILDTGVLVSLPLVILFCALLWIINSRPKGVVRAKCPANSHPTFLTPHPPPPELQAPGRRGGRLGGRRVHVDGQRDPAGVRPVAALRRAGGRRGVGPHQLPLTAAARRLRHRLLPVPVLRRGAHALPRDVVALTCHEDMFDKKKIVINFSLSLKIQLTLVKLPALGKNFTKAKFFTYEMINKGGRQENLY